MPEKKREKFADFAATLMPHELQHIENIQKLIDPENLRILEQIRHCTKHPFEPIQRDKSIDKRKYSYMKKWISEKLEAIDADSFFFAMIELEKKIMTDAINPEEEKALYAQIRSYNKQGYYFIRFYELVQNYHYYLLIRMRYNYIQPITAFLESWKSNYLQSKNIHQELHEATIDIVDQYASHKKESKQWENRLIQIFNDSALDGLNRYNAIVRLTFIYYNYKEYDKLFQLYEQLDKLIVDGLIYSKRILANYYANRVLLHARYNQLDEAVYYGMLSMRYKGTDYLFYVTNLCAVLLRYNKGKDALKLMQENLHELKNTMSHHTRIGFASFYIQSLTKNNKVQQALSYARTFLEINRSEILKFRWHLFFTSMLQAMMILEKYAEIIKMVKKFDLLKLEMEHAKRSGYLPALLWYYKVACYKECHIDETNLLKTLTETAKTAHLDLFKIKQFQELMNEIKPHIVQLPLELMAVKHKTEI